MTVHLIFHCRIAFLVVMYLLGAHNVSGGDRLRLDEYNRLPAGAADYRFFLDRADLFYSQEEYASALEHYLFALAIGSSLDQNKIIQFRTGYCLLQNNEPLRAIGFFRPLTADTLMGDYALYQLAGCYTMIPDSQKKAVGIYRNLIRQYPNSVFRIDAHLQIIEWLSRTQQHTEANVYIAATQALIQNNYQTRLLYEPRFTLLKGISQYYRGRYQKAINYFRIVIGSFRYTEEAYQAKHWIEKIIYSLLRPLSSDQFLENNNVLILQGYYADALRELKSRERSGNPRDNTALDFQTARAYLAMGRYEEATNRFESLWDERSHAESLFNLARAARYQDELDLSTRAYRAYLVSAAKNTAWKNYIRFELANNLAAYGDSARMREAIALYRAIQDPVNGSSSYAAGAAFREAYQLYRLKEYDSAVVKLTGLESQAPTQQSRCRYWIAKCYQRSGQNEKADIIFRQLAVHRMTDYYGMLSELLHMNPVSATPRRIFYTTGIPLLRNIHEPWPVLIADTVWGVRREGTDLVVPESLSDSLRYAIRKAMLADRLIGTRWAESELMTVRDLFWSSFERNLWLKQLSEIMGCYNIAVDANVMLRIYHSRRLSSDDINRLNYPLYYRDYIALHAAQYMLDPSLLLAVIKAESAFRSRAVSPARAVGLMQIMPFTGRAIARQLQISSFQMMNLQSPDVSIRMGAFYLHQQARAFKGFIPAMLSAYNAGPHRTVFWMHFYDEDDPEAYPEMVDFAETHAYIKKILLDRWIYSQLYQADPS